MALFRFTMKSKSRSLPQEETPSFKTAKDFENEWARNRQVAPMEMSVFEKIREFFSGLFSK